MRVAIVYICVTRSPQAAELAAKFIASYDANPPGGEHDLVVVSNGGKLSSELLAICCGADSIVERANDPGWDISAFIEVAKTICSEHDLLVCLGESAYFPRASWLNRLIQAAGKYGPGMYGILSSNSVRPHLNTSAFSVTPRLLAQWPAPRNKRERYAFEHGAKPFWRSLVDRGFPVRLVTWDGDWVPHRWREPKNIMWRGDQSNCLVWTKHTDRWFHANPQMRERWSRNADQSYR